jgi:hypothetical protein
MSHCGGRATSPTLAQVRLSPFSSRPSRAQRDEADLKMDFDGLELKLHEVHFAVKLSEAEAEENLTAKCTECSFNPMSTRRLPSTPSRACEARCTWQFPSWHWGRVGEVALPPQCVLTLARRALALMKKIQLLGHTWLLSGVLNLLYYKIKLASPQFFFGYWEVY